MKRYRFYTAALPVFPLIFLIFAACACQANTLPQPAATTDFQLPAATLTGTLPIPTASPSALTPSETPRPSITPSPRPSATATQAPLTAGGPWLLYQRVIQYPEGGFSEVLFVSNPDGSGKQVLYEPGCDTDTPISIVEDANNRLVILDRKTVLIHLDRADARVVSPHCKTKFSGSEAGGWLAAIHQAPGVAELRVYTLPAGKLIHVFPIPSCAEQACGFDNDQGSWVAEWDPSGQSLVFPVILNGEQSDLYRYNVQDGTTRRLASIQGRVSKIWWSPKGRNLLLGISPTGDFFLESFWAAAADGGEARRLSTAEENLWDVDLLDWLDEDRFLFYTGSLPHVVTVGASNLRMLDIRSNTETSLFRDGFLRAGLDPASGVVGMVVVVYNSQMEDGVYLVPAARPTPQKIAPVQTEGIYNTFWNADLRLFISGDPCQEGGQAGYRAFDSQGKWHCASVYEPTPTPPAVDFLSHDGQWRVTAQEGLWVEGPGKPALKAHDETPIQVIWRPDSAGFFFFTRTGLYYASLPDRTIQALDAPGQLRNGLRWSLGAVEYQWIEPVGGT